jgi:hypothetical protein
METAPARIAALEAECSSKDARIAYLEAQNGELAQALQRLSSLAAPRQPIGGLGSLSAMGSSLGARSLSSRWGSDGVGVGAGGFGVGGTSLGAPHGTDGNGAMVWNLGGRDRSSFSSTRGSSFSFLDNREASFTSSSSSVRSQQSQGSARALSIRGLSGLSSSSDDQDFMTTYVFVKRRSGWRTGVGGGGVAKKRAKEVGERFAEMGHDPD